MGTRNLGWIHHGSGKAGGASISHYLQGRAPLHHYKMQMASGAAVDAGSVGNDITASGTVVYQEPSTLLPATDYSVLCGDYGGATNGGFAKTSGETFTIASTSSFAVVMWVKIHPSCTSVASFMTMFQFEAASNQPRIGMYFDSSEALTIIANDDAGTACSRGLPKAAFFDVARSGLTQLVAVFDRNLAAGPTVYVNGTETAGSGDLGNFSTMGALTFSNDKAYLGNYSNPDYAFNGWIYELWLSEGTGWYDSYNSKNYWTLQHGGLVFYKFNEASGNLIDAGSAAQNLTVQNTANLSYQDTDPEYLYNTIDNSAGDPNYGNFEETGPCTSIGISTNNFVVVFHVQLPVGMDPNATGEHPGIFQLWDTNGTAQGLIHAFFAPTDGTLDVVVNDNTPDGIHVLVDHTDLFDKLIDDGALHEIVMIFDRSQGAVEMKLDGEPLPVYHDANTTYVRLNDLGAITIDGDRNVMQVDGREASALRGKMGQLWLGGNTTDYLKNFPKYEGQITAPSYSYQGGSPLIHYKFNGTGEGSGIGVFDFGSAQQNLSSQINTPEYRIAGPSGLWYGIGNNDGTARFQDITTPTSCVIPAGDFCFVVWVKFDANPTETQRGVFVLEGNTGPARLRMYYDVVNQKMQFQAIDDSTNWWSGEVAKADLWDVAEGSWAEVQFLGDVSEAKPTIKVNGTAVTVTTLNNTFSDLADNITLDKWRIMLSHANNDINCMWGAMAEFWLSTGLTVTDNWS